MRTDKKTLEKLADKILENYMGNKEDEYPIISPKRLKKIKNIEISCGIFDEDFERFISNQKHGRYRP